MLLGSFWIVMMTLGGLASKSTLKGPKGRKFKIAQCRLRAEKSPKRPLIEKRSSNHQVFI